MKPLRIVICGLSITSSWGNGHATTYRGLVKELVANGNEVLFLERDRPWYSAHRDLPAPPYGRTELYSTLEEFKDRFTGSIREADAVIVGSFVPEGIELGDWVTKNTRGLSVFYDIDTPEPLAHIGLGSCEYLTRELVARYQLYLSFTGGPTLQRLEKEFGSPMARPLFCSVDPLHYYPQKGESSWDLGYLGTYSPDRQPTLETLLLEPARNWPEGHFIVAGAQFPGALDWGKNVKHVEHLPPSAHRDFYNALRFTLNVTRKNMIRAGHSPSVRLFEAAACGTPIISDYWSGLELLFKPGLEILIARHTDDVNRMLRRISEEERLAIGERARKRILNSHTAAHRACELQQHFRDALNRKSVNDSARNKSWKLKQADNYVRR
ncbi:MAG: glycosyltransferase [Bdellovibrionales bacterium GWC1_52_8]|nr:MAG: glycosyltransferase [Bdellovibrionales bacterium GWC1_52_8]